MMDTMQKVAVNQLPPKHLTWQMLTKPRQDNVPVMTTGQAKKFLRTVFNQEVWENSLYQASVNRKMNKVFGAEIAEIAITRKDKDAIHDWRHFQQIKNDLVGEDVEAIEIYPNENRLMDTANTYWLYAFPKGYIMPFGFMTPRNIASSERGAMMGATQRTFEDTGR